MYHQSQQSQQSRLFHLLHTIFITATLMLCGVGVFYATPVVAREPVISVVSSSATADFPTHITFDLTATSATNNIVRVELLYGFERLESQTIIPLSVTPSKQIETAYTLDTLTYHMPPGVTITYQWVIYDDAGTYLQTDLQTLAYDDTRFVWQQRTLADTNVTVHWYDGGASFGDTLHDVTARAMQHLQQEIGVAIQHPINIYIYANGNDMQAALQSNEVEWVGGQAWTNIGVVIAAIAPGDTQEVQRIIPHELSHQVLHQATDNPYGGVPLWFEEGLAVYNQEIQLSYDRPMVEEAARNGQLIPLEALAASFPTDQAQANLSYAQSYSVVAYILDTYGEEAMHQLIAAFATATPLEEAFNDIFNMTVDEFDVAWQGTLPTATHSALPTTTTPVVNAPADRFADEPVVPTDTPITDTAIVQDMPYPTMPQPTPTPTHVVAVTATLPDWAEMGLAIGCCLTLLLIVSGVTFVTIRLFSHKNT